MRLESEILEELQEVCRKNDITVETLLEAFHIICKSNDSLMRRSLRKLSLRISGGRKAEGRYQKQDRYAKRKIAGEMQRLKTDNKRYQRGG